MGGRPGVTREKYAVRAEATFLVALAEREEFCATSARKFAALGGQCSVGSNPCALLHSSHAEAHRPSVAMYFGFRAFSTKACAESERPLNGGSEWLRRGWSLDPWVSRAGSAGAMPTGGAPWTGSSARRPRGGALALCPLPLS